MSSIYYKYRPLNGHTEQLLRNQEISFSFGHEYNDPFDSKVRIDNAISKEDVLLKLDETPLPKDTKQNLCRGIENGTASIEMYCFAAHEVAKTTVMSSCFSSDQLNILMWSHYADSHRGICIGLANVSTEAVPAMKFFLGNIPGDPPTLENGVFPVYEVKYDRSDIVLFNPGKDDISTFIDAHTTKAKCWEYEKEQRVILAYKEYGKKILRFDRRYLQEIYLGARISKLDKLKVLDIVKDEYLRRNIPVRVFQTKISTERFELDVEEINMSSSF